MHVITLTLTILSTLSCPFCHMCPTPHVAPPLIPAHSNRSSITPGHRTPGGARRGTVPLKHMPRAAVRRRCVALTAAVSASRTINLPCVHLPVHLQTVSPAQRRRASRQRSASVSHAPEARVGRRRPPVQPADPGGWWAVAGSRSGGG